MIKHILILLFIFLPIAINPTYTLAAAKDAGEECNLLTDTCPSGLFCQTNRVDPNKQFCELPLKAGEICIDETNVCRPNLFCQTNPADPTTQTCQPALKAGEICIDTTSKCITGFTCQPSAPDRKVSLCQKNSLAGIFGTIKPPAALIGLLKTDPTGAGAISHFLSNLIALIFSIASIVLILMLLWGAFDWIISEGDKEKIAAAQRKLINAVIGIILFAIAFAIIRVLGLFTGFTFFAGQNYTVTERNPDGSIRSIRCLNGTPVVGQPGTTITNPDTACRKP